eukprot:UN22548
MLFLTSKLLKNVNFGLLDHFGQRVLTICVLYDQIHFEGLQVFISSPFPQNIMSRNAKLIMGGRKNHFFVPSRG